MIVIAAEVLDGAALATVRGLAAGLDWDEGARTAGPVARAVKHNQQARTDSRGGRTLVALLESRIRAHPVFAAAVRPLALTPLLVSRTGPGGGYGAHVDNPFMSAPGGPDGARVRTDVSFTLFLSGPDTFDGGELSVDTPLNDQDFKLPAGDMVIYPTAAIHQVRPVTAGERLVCVGWAQSRVRDPAARETLWDLERLRHALPEATGADTRLLLDKTIANLLRRWAD